MTLKLVHPEWFPRRTRAFACTLEHRGSGVAGVHIAGELRAASSPELARTLRQAERQARITVLDLRQLTSVDACGVHVIMAAGVRARRAGRRLVVVRRPVPADPILTLGGSPSVVDVVDLQPGQPAVQALLELAHRDRAA